MPIARVRLPDGRIGRFEVDEGLAPEDVEQYIAGMFPQSDEQLSKPDEQINTTPATTISGEVLEVLKGIPSGAIGLLQSAATGAAAILPDQAERAVRGQIEDIAGSLREPFEAAAGYEESIGRRAGEALGSTAPFFALGPLGVAGRLGAAGLGVSAGAGEARVRAEQEGGMEDRGAATALGALVGATEVVPVFRFADRILDRLPSQDKGLVLEYVKRAALAGGEEFAQEASANIAQNLIAKGLYKPDQDIFEGSAEEGAYGFGVGAFVQGLTDLALGRRVRGAVAPPEGEDGRARVGVEQVVEGTDTGGIDLPVSRVGAEGPDVEGLGAAGVGVPRGPIGRVDEGTEGLQPTLEPARFQMEEPDSWYYSELSRATDRAKVEKTKPDQWLNVLRQTPGVKQEEIDATGLEDWLKLQGDRTVTKQEISDYVKNNGVQVEEIISAPANFQVFMDGDNTGISFGSKEEAENFVMESAWNNLQDAVGMGVIDPEIDESGPLYETELERYDIKPPEEIEGGPRYAEYQVPGGKNYREILLTLPQKPGEETYQSHNWNESRGEPIKNVLAHLRVDDRVSPIPGLKNNLFVQEVQSDWGQEARKFGYKTKEDKIEIQKLNEEGQEIGSEIAEIDIRRDEFYTVYNAARNKLAKLGFDVELDAKLKPEFFDKNSWRTITADKITSGRYRPTDEVDAKRFKEALPDMTFLIEIAPQSRNIELERNEAYKKFAENQNKVAAVLQKTPRAPLIGKTESWLNLSLKRALTYAAEKGYDSISFAKGREVQQAVGGEPEGQKKFYDQILPQTLKKLAPKFGGQLEMVGDRPVIRLTPEMRTKLLGKVPLFKMGKRPAKGLGTSEVQKVVENLSRGWANKPNIKIVNTHKDLPKAYRSDKYKGVRGMLLGNDVYIVAANAGSPSEVKATLFHESLGHYGLRGLFNDKLDKALNDIYATNSAVRTQADAWLRKHPDVYTGVDRVARSVEEVLAAKSEAGVIKEPGIRAAFNRLAAMIRKFIRGMGIQLNYTNNDINNILLESAERVRVGPMKLAMPDARPRYQVSQYDNVISSALSRNQNLPQWSQSVGDGVAETLSNLPENLRRGQYYVYSMPHMVELLERYIPRIRAIDRFIGYRASYTTDLMKTAADNHAKYSRIVQENPQDYDKFKDVVNDINLFQVPVRSQAVRDLLTQDRATLSPQKQKYYDIAKKFYDLPEAFQNSILSADERSGLFADYRKMGDKKFDIFADVYGGQLGMGVVRDLRERFERERLPMYAPLVRGEGAHWLYYETTDGQVVKQPFSNAAAREKEIKRITQEGLANTNTIQRVTRPSEIRQKGPPPVGFLGEVVSKLEDKLSDMPEAQRKEIIDGVYDTFLQYLPSNMLRQELTSRQTSEVDGAMQFGVLGFDQDVLAVYDRTMPKMAYQLGNLKFALPIENAMKKIMEQAKLYEIAVRDNNIPERLRGRKLMSPKAVFDGVEDMRRRLNFAYNPSYAPWVNAAATGNYVYSIAGNVSSALINTTVLAMMTWPMLMAKYGPVKSIAAMGRAMKMFLEGGVDDQGNFTFGNAASGELKTLFNYLEKRGAIGIAAEQELRQAQRAAVSGYESTMDKINFVAGYVFKNSERFNREVTMLASYMLAREKGKGFREAAEEAIRLNNNINGTVLPEQASRMYQTNLGRVILTFRTFALTQIIALSRMFGRGLKIVDATPEERSLARKQLLGVYGATYMMAGVKGLPLFGAAEVLAAALMGDDDEPYDLQQEVIDSVGLLGLNGPLNAALQVDIASRTGFNGMLWRDDPKRLAEVGYPLYIAERVAGPTYGLVQAQIRGIENLMDGEVQRGFESILPAPLRNPLKAARYATEGALTKNGLPMVDDVNAWNSTMQILGFAPAELAATQEQIGATFQISDKLRNRRTALLTNVYAATEAGDAEAMIQAYEAIDKFNAANPSYSINPKSLRASFRERRRRALEAVNGIYLPRNLRMATDALMAEPY